MNLKMLMAWGRPVGACLAIAGMLCLASCESQTDVAPAGNQFAADSSAHNGVAGDPPVKPSGPGGGG